MFFYVYRPMSFCWEARSDSLYYGGCGRQRACSLKDTSSIIQKAEGLQNDSGGFVGFCLKTHEKQITSDNKYYKKACIQKKMIHRHLFNANVSPLSESRHSATPRRLKYSFDYLPKYTSCYKRIVITSCNENARHSCRKIGECDYSSASLSFCT